MRIDSSRLRDCATHRPSLPRLDYTAIQFAAIGLVAIVDLLTVLVSRLSPQALPLFVTYPQAAIGEARDLQSVIVGGTNQTLVSVNDTGGIQAGPVTCVERLFAGTAEALPNTAVDAVVEALAHSHNALKAAAWTVPTGWFLYIAALVLLRHLRRKRRRAAGRDPIKSGLLRSLGSNVVTSIFIGWTFAMSCVYWGWTMFSRADARSVEGQTTTVKGGFGAICSCVGLSTVAFVMSIYATKRAGRTLPSDHDPLFIDLEQLGSRESGKTTTEEINQLTAAVKDLLSATQPSILTRPHPLKRHGQPGVPPAVPAKDKPASGAVASSSATVQAPKRSWLKKLKLGSGK